MVHAFEDLKKKYPNIDEFLLKKWDRIFGIFFDRNHSDDLTAADFYIIMRQARSIYGGDSAQTKYAKEAMTKLWEGLKKSADENSDEKISIDEWVHVLQEAEKDKSHESGWFKDYNGFLFKLFDVSEDAVLDQTEYADGLRCYGYSEADAIDAFKKFAGVPKAHGHPVHVDRATFTALFNEYFFSKDRAAKGNDLFGVLPADF